MDVINSFLMMNFNTIGVLESGPAGFRALHNLLQSAFRLMVQEVTLPM
jgi:hypothetical protein